MTDSVVREATPMEEHRRKFDAGEHTCEDPCPRHGRVVCACLHQCRPCREATDA